MEYYKSILQVIEEGRKVANIHLNFSKAFDKVDHGVLHHKLRDLGIHGKMGNWLHAFLHNRQQSVVVEGHKSDPSTVISGVPQGTVLGPILFLVLILDISHGTDAATRVTSFADDTRASRPIHSQTDIDVLQQDIDTIYSWADRVSMEFNGDKFECIKIEENENIKDDYLHTVPKCCGSINDVNSLRDLGVIISDF